VFPNPRRHVRVLIDAGAARQAYSRFVRQHECFWKNILRRFLPLRKNCRLEATDRPKSWRFCRQRDRCFSQAPARPFPSLALRSHACGVEQRNIAQAHKKNDIPYISTNKEKTRKLPGQNKSNAFVERERHGHTPFRHFCGCCLCRAGWFASKPQESPPKYVRTRERTSRPKIHLSTGCKPADPTHKKTACQYSWTP